MRLVHVEPPRTFTGGQRNCPSLFARASAGYESESRSSPVAVSALVIDMCGVLYDDSCWKRWMFQIVCRMRPGCSYETFSKKWESRFADQAGQSEFDSRSALRTSLAALGLSSGQLDEACAAGVAKQRCFEQNIQPLPGVRRSLAAWHAERECVAALGLGPWTKKQLQARLERLRVQAHVPLLFSAREMALEGRYSERYRILQETLGTAQPPPAFVSARPSELAAARQQGFTTISFGGCHAEGDAHVEQFDQLLNRLRFDTSRGQAC